MILLCLKAEEKESARSPTFDPPGHVIRRIALVIAVAFWIGFFVWIFS